MLKFIEVNIYLKVENFDLIVEHYGTEFLSIFKSIRQTKMKDKYICSSYRLDINTSPCSTDIKSKHLYEIFNYLQRFYILEEIKSYFEEWSCLMVIYDQNFDQYDLLNLDQKTIGMISDLGLALQFHVNDFS